MSQHFDVIICGAGSIGVAATYYLAQQKGITKVLLVDKHAPLSQTSAKSGENYRNWWPQEVMVRLTNGCNPKKGQAKISTVRLNRSLPWAKAQGG